MENIFLKRNILEDLRLWDIRQNGPLLLYGMKGVGKAFICKEYARMKESFMYYEPELSLIKEGNVKEKSAVEYTAQHFGLSKEALGANFLILNETEKAEEFFKALFETAVREQYKWIFISDYDYLEDEYPEQYKLHMFPVQFDEFLINLGYNDWYVSSIGENLKRREKLPDIVHNNLLSTFEEYLWTGGMPDVVEEYIKEHRLGIRCAQQNSKMLSYSILDDEKDSSLLNKCRQILDTVDVQLNKSNKKFMFSLIRSGVTYQMYSSAIERLVQKGLILKINELFDERKFKLFYPEFSFNSQESFDEITDVEFLLREENYILQTFKQKGIDVCFWESGNRAELPFVIRKKDCELIPVDYNGESRRVSKSLKSYSSKYNNGKALIISTTNFSTDGLTVSIPVYSIFCIEKLLEVLV